MHEGRRERTTTTTLWKRLRLYRPASKSVSLIEALAMPPSGRATPAASASARRRQRVHRARSRMREGRTLGGGAAGGDEVREHVDRVEGACASSKRATSAIRPFSATRRCRERTRRTAGTLGVELDAPDALARLRGRHDALDRSCERVRWFRQRLVGSEVSRRESV